MNDRDPNLDLLRAGAISLVVLCNAAVESVGPSSALAPFLLSGWMGVDLFFVLSGWLVGGLYWREEDRFGSVEVGRFWARRWLRTIPPYLVALHVVFVAQHVVLGSEAPYDVRYLFFLQNYDPTIPYWAVSWSLCVEEHLYLALPLVLGVVRGPRAVLGVLGGLAVVSLVGRLVAPIGEVEGISGLLYTETHLRLEGLAFGVAAAYVAARHPAAWSSLVGACRRLVVPAVAGLAFVAVLSTETTLRVGFTLVDVSMAVLLVAVAGRRPLPGASSRVVRGLAAASYSVYMTHTAVLEGVARMEGALPDVLRFVVALGLVGVVGGAFYVTVERPTLWLRERWAPRRTDGRAPEVRPPAFTVDEPSSHHAGSPA